MTVVTKDMLAAPAERDMVQLAGSRLLIPNHLKQELDEQRHAKELCGRIRNNRHLGAILKTVKPARRRAVYDSLKPHLPFKVAPYICLKFR